MTAYKSPWTLHLPDLSGSACGKCYTYTSDWKPSATFMDSTGAYTNQNGIQFNADGVTTLFASPHYYNLVYTESNDTVSIGYPVLSVHGGNFDAKLTPVLTLISGTLDSLNEIIDTQSVSDAKLILYQSDLDNKSDSDHTHVSSEILNIDTGYNTLPDGVFGLYNTTDVPHSNGYWICFETPSGGFDPAPYTTRVIDTRYNEGLVPTWFEVVDGGLKCVKACNIIVNFVSYPSVTYSIDLPANQVLLNGEMLHSSQFGSISLSAIKCEIDDVIAFRFLVSTLVNGAANLAIYIAPESMSPEAIA